MGINAASAYLIFPVLLIVWFPPWSLQLRTWWNMSQCRTNALITRLLWEPRQSCCQKNRERLRGMSQRSTSMAQGITGVWLAVSPRFDAFIAFSCTATPSITTSPQKRSKRSSWILGSRWLRAQFKERYHQFYFFSLICISPLLTRLYVSTVVLEVTHQHLWKRASRGWSRPPLPPSQSHSIQSIGRKPG